MSCLSLKLRINKNSIYQITERDYIFIVIKGVGIISCISYLFYASFAVALVLSPLLILYIKYEEREKIRGLRRKLNLQLKDALEAIASSLGAGYSIENSMVEARKALVLIYEESDLMVLELDKIINRMRMNIPVETAFYEFAVRCDLEEAFNFAWILISAKRTGGNLLRISRQTSMMIAQKIEVEREIATMIASKKYESAIMNLIPLVIIVYLKLFSTDFLSPLYGNLLGVLIMSILLCVYILAFWISKKMIKIKV